MTQPATEFDPTAIVGLGHNAPPADPFDDIRQEIEDLYDEARNFCDGKPIDTQALADVVTELHDRIHAAGKKADDLRIVEKTPLDDAVKAIQAKYAPLISDTKSVKGKVTLGKEALSALLTPWRTAKAAAAKAEADRIAAEAAEATRLATEAIRASSGNLAAREEAEELLSASKRLEKTAARAERAATTGLGLRTVWSAEIANDDEALSWAYGHAPGEFMALALSLANEQVRSGVRVLPGFVVTEGKVAR